MNLKKYLSIFLILFITTNINAQVVEFDRLYHSLERVNLSDIRDSVVYYDFNFTNIGTSPLKIFTVLTTCGCTTPIFNKKSYEPGASGVIRLSYNVFLTQDSNVTMLAEIYTNSLNSGSRKGVHNLKLEAIFDGNSALLTPEWNSKLIPHIKLSHFININFLIILDP